jgi:hypothetical protein
VSMVVLFENRKISNFVGALKATYSRPVPSACNIYGSFVTAAAIRKPFGRGSRLMCQHGMSAPP